MVSSLPAAAEEVPAAASYTVTGYGYGHGHGLSQYGAQGAANQGLSWKQIIGFYYPGTRLGKARGTVRCSSPRTRRTSWSTPATGSGSRG